jgi:hypothetical protein
VTDGAAREIAVTGGDSFVAVTGVALRPTGASSRVVFAAQEPSVLYLSVVRQGDTAAVSAVSLERVLHGTSTALLVEGDAKPPSPSLASPSTSLSKLATGTGLRLRAGLFAHMLFVTADSTADSQNSREFQAKNGRILSKCFVSPATVGCL